MYNFGVFLANEAAAEDEKRKRKAGNKHQYAIDFSTTIRQSRKYFLRRPEEKTVDIIKLLCKFVHAVKEPFRKFPRSLRGIGAIRFTYR